MEGIGIVKSVLSGDTLVLLGTAPRPGVAPPELQLSLSHCNAPRVSRHPEVRDDPFGWPAREFLRSKLVGRQVHFKVDYKVERIGRLFATVRLISEPENSVNMIVASSGWARVSSLDAASKGQSPEYEALVAASHEAEEAGYGLFNKTPGLAEATVRTIQWNFTPAQANELAEEWSTTPQRAIVEQVVNGAVIRCLLTETSPSYAITVALAGVACPRVPAATPAPAAAAVPAPEPSAAATGKPSWARGSAAAAAAPPAAAAAGAGAPGAKPAGEDAQDAQVTAAAIEGKLLTESLLLNRDVTLHVVKVEKNGSFVARLETADGMDIVTELLTRGLGKISDWSLTPAFDATQITVLRAAERKAKAAKAGVWYNFVAPTIRGERLFEGKVVEVSSGDTLVVAIPRAPAAGAPVGVPDERRVSLSSIRAPRMGNVRRQEKDAPYAAEAKEWLRRAAIGRNVIVHVDYSRAAAAAGLPADAADTPGAERAFATVTLSTRKGDTLNLALGIVSEGLANVVRHRSDEERAEAYDALLVAEEAARTAKKGLHSGKEPVAARRGVDLTGDASATRANLGFLQRAGTMRGMVEFVFAGGRMKVHSSTSNYTFMFGISGLRCPATARTAYKGKDGKMVPGRAAEPMGAEAFAYLRDLVNQQEVELEAEDCDKASAVLGPMWIGKGGARKSVGVELLRQGLAYCLFPSVTRLKNADELVTAEAEAKAAKRGVWAFYTEPVEEDDEAVFDGSDEALAPAAAAAGDAPAPAAGEAADTAAFPKLGGWGARAGVAAAKPAGAAGGVATGVVSMVYDGGRFAVQFSADDAKLASIQSKLEALRAEVGTQCAMVDTKKGKLVACLHEGDDGVLKWYRARIDGACKEKSSDGYDLYDVTFIDIGFSDKMTVQRMRPLDASLTTVPGIAKECVLALLRVPALGAEHGNEAANALQDWVHGVKLRIKSHGKDMAGRLQVSLWEEDGSCINAIMIESGVARIASTLAHRVLKRGGDEKDVELLRMCEAAREAAKKARAGMYCYGDVGDSDDERR